MTVSFTVYVACFKAGTVILGFLPMVEKRTITNFICLWLSFGCSMQPTSPVLYSSHDDSPKSNFKWKSQESNPFSVVPYVERRADP